ncbi:hypothetical protein L0P88_20890 [Muricauda sp. SCSIO 64092]|uniref:hypothetical protein n=1 Tax=Allomuricauda sp. SCSIO 64092 TaxID=2908842 RepID=UPI001FF10AB2|nr:hypothetical protein [Muricauda sp. SCSIO 64092]UOY06365.1 hypothetical protein L0P88_20890 [Muricauda sp. SCSIO 64092]
MGCYIPFLGQWESSDPLGSVLADMGTFYRRSCTKIPSLFLTDERDECFDQEPYDERYALELTNTWMDSHRSLLNRFDTTTENWKGFNYL